MKASIFRRFEPKRAIKNSVLIRISRLIFFSLLAASPLLAVQITAGATYFEDFAVNGPAPPEYKPVGGASIENSGGSLIVTASSAGGMQGFQLTYPATVNGQPLSVFCTEFEADLPKLAPSTGNSVQVTFFESPGNVETTITRNSDGTYFLRVRKNGADVFRQDRVLLPEGFVKYRFDKVGENRVTLERVRSDNSFERVFDVDPPDNGLPFSSAVFTTDTNRFAIGSIKAGLHVPRLLAPTLSEWGIVILAFLLLLTGWIFLRKKPAFGASVILTLVICSHASGQVTTAKTDEIDLGMARDGVGVPGVKVKKTISVDGAKGKVTSQCTFINENAGARTFAFCNMIGLKISNESEKVDTTECCFLTRLRDPRGNPPDLTSTNNIRCVKVACGSSAAAPKKVQPSFHFGCIVVTVPGAAGGTPGRFTPPPSITPELDKFKNKKASDFEVTYADIIKMEGLTFDSGGTCAGCFRDCSFTALGSSILDPPGPDVPIAGSWVAQTSPFKDPFLRYEGGPIEYAAFRDTPCTPNNFPETVAQLPKCPSGGVIPNFIKKDINLFDIYSMSESRPIPAFLTIETRTPLPPGVTIETSPPPRAVFNMPPVEELFGTLTIQSPSFMPEGTRLDLIIRLHDAATGKLLFPQHNTFIHDTVPPQVVGRPIAFFDQAGRLHAEVTAFDATTEPLNAVLWFSTDHGMTWSFQEMRPQSSILEDRSTRTFQIEVGPFAAGTFVRFFFSSQDQVENVIYFGIGELAIPITTLSVPTLSQWGLIIMALLLLTSGTVFIRRTQQTLVGAGVGHLQLAEKGNPTLFAQKLFIKSLALMLTLAGAGIGLTAWLSRPINATDVGGTLISAVIIAYLAHLLILSSKESKAKRD